MFSHREQEAMMALRLLYHRWYDLRDLGDGNFAENDDSDDSVVHVDTFPTSAALEEIQRRLGRCC